MNRIATPEQLDEAVRRGIVTRGQADALWEMLGEAGETAAAATPPANPKFTFTNVLYYFGGMLAIGAMTLFMTIGWGAFGGWGVFFIALIYASVALRASAYLRHRNLATPAGILAALAIALVPLAIYGLQLAIGWWPPNRPYRDYHYWIDWRWATMEAATLAVGGAILFWHRLPFAMMPISVTLWYMSMDFAPLLAGGEDADGKLRKTVAIVFGLAMTAAGAVIDSACRRRPDFGFWMWFFGVISFWGGLSLSDSGSELGKFLYACINAAMVFAGAIVARRILTVLGGLGMFGYLGYLSYRVFKDSLIFPFALTALGLALVAAGIWWQKREASISARFRRMLPAGFRAALEESQG